VSNPPYIEADDLHLKRGDVRFEPLSALASGEDGLDDIRHLVTHAANFLRQDGMLMFEHGYDQGKRTTILMQAAGYEGTRCIKDLSGHDRITLGHAPL
ncbi:MAG: Protein-N(5)-glutamine methyltransferase PrmC, methylates polypeptide chain release factors RF1 and RF2, partial [uncultured Thiotrichaceae bacterium]